MTAPDRIWAAYRADGQRVWSEQGPTRSPRQLGSYVHIDRYNEAVAALKAMADASLGTGAEDEASLAARFQCYETASRAEELL